MKSRFPDLSNLLSRHLSHQSALKLFFSNVAFRTVCFNSVLTDFHWLTLMKTNWGLECSNKPVWLQEAQLVYKKCPLTVKVYLMLQMTLSFHHQLKQNAAAYSTVPLPSSPLSSHIVPYESTQALYCTVRSELIVSLGDWYFLWACGCCWYVVTVIWRQIESWGLLFCFDFW